MVWDEAEYFVRARNIVEWFRVLPNALSKEEIQTYWLFIHYAEGHPAGFALPIALGQWLFSGFLDPLTASRLGPITLFSIACAGVAVRLRKHLWDGCSDRGARHTADISTGVFRGAFRNAGWTTHGVVALAVGDSIGACTRMGRNHWTGRCAGIHDGHEIHGMAGVGADCHVASRSQKCRCHPPAARHPSCRTSDLLFLNPPIWYEPLDGLRDHFHRSLDRANALNISTQFLGTLVQRHESPPLVQHGRVARLRHAAADIGARNCGPLALPRQADGVLSDADASLDHIDGRTRAARRTATRWHPAVSAGIRVLVRVRRHWRPTRFQSHRHGPRRVVENSAAPGAFRRSSGERRQPRSLLSPNAVALQSHRGRSSRCGRQGHGTGVLVGCARQRRPQVARSSVPAPTKPSPSLPCSTWATCATGASCARTLWTQRHAGSSGTCFRTGRRCSRAPTVF